MKQNKITTREGKNAIEGALQRLKEIKLKGETNFNRWEDSWNPLYPEEKGEKNLKT